MSVLRIGKASKVTQAIEFDCSACRFADDLADADDSTNVMASVVGLS